MRKEKILPIIIIGIAAILAVEPGMAWGVFPFPGKYTVPVFQQPRPSLPDLTVADISVNGGFITATIKNVGTATAKDFYVVFYINERKYQYFVQSLNPGSSIKISPHFDPYIGSYTLPCFYISVIVDPYNSVREMSEFNNKKSVTWCPFYRNR